MTMDYEDSIIDALQSRDMPTDVRQALRAIIEREVNRRRDGDINVIERWAFTDAVECPECGSLILPGLLCWNCEEWTAPAMEL